MRTTDSCRGSYVDGLPKTSRPTVYSLRFWASPKRDFSARYVSRLRCTSDVLKVLLEIMRWTWTWFASSSGSITQILHGTAGDRWPGIGGRWITGHRPL